MSEEVSTIVDRKDLIDKLNSAPYTEYYSFIMTEASKEIVKIEAERDALQAKIKQLEAQLEEERQENASLRSGSIDDYERGAE